jgi:hypothetical protein
MSVSLADGLVVGPTSRYDETWVVRADLGIDRVHHDDPAGTGVIVGVDDAGSFEITPEAKVGDGTQGLAGALDFSFGVFKMQLVSGPVLAPTPDPPLYGDADGDGDVDRDDKLFIQAHLNERVPPGPASADLTGDGRITGRDVAAMVHLLNEVEIKPSEFTAATFNLFTLFDTYDGDGSPALTPEEYELKLDKLAETIHDALREPTLIAIQEVENMTVVEDLADRPEIDADYEAVLGEGLTNAGFDVGLMYRTDRVTVLQWEERQGCTTLVDGLGPDGHGGVTNPSNDITCDSDGDGVLDGNRLHYRPPLVVHTEIRCPDPDCDRVQDLWVIVNHFISKGPDTDEIAYSLPRRTEEAAHVAELVDEILAVDPQADVMVMGDLNDTVASLPLAALTAGELDNLLVEVPLEERYSYIYQGVSETIDHILISPDLWENYQIVEPAHVNADYPAEYQEVPDLARGGSDHDPVIVRFYLER